MNHQDGCCDMIALHNHYAGEGNSTHHISDANQIKSTLHYKSEHALPFSKFLDSMQKMFTIFQEEGEPLTEQAKVDELLTKVQHPGLTAAIAQLCYQLNTKGITFTVTANHLNSAISQTPDYQMAWHINSTNSFNQPIVLIKTDVLGDMVVVTMAMVDMVAVMVMVVDTDMVTTTTTTTTQTK